jgi:hypothetical protein
MISDCLKEREFQVAINRRKEELEQMLERKHLDMVAEELQRQDHLELLKKREEHKKKLRN